MWLGRSIRPQRCKVRYRSSLPLEGVQSDFNGRQGGEIRRPERDVPDHLRGLKPGAEIGKNRHEVTRGVLELERVDRSLEILGRVLEHELGSAGVPERHVSGGQVLQAGPSIIGGDHDPMAAVAAQEYEHAFGTVERDRGKAVLLEPLDLVHDLISEGLDLEPLKGSRVGYGAHAAAGNQVHHPALERCGHSANCIHYLSHHRRLSWITRSRSWSRLSVGSGE